MGIGEKLDSGSESKPEEGEINIQELPLKYPKKEEKISKSVPEDKFIGNRSVRFGTRKSSREIKITKDMIKPLRNKVLVLSQVNAVLPDKYHMGLQPIKRREVNNFSKGEIGCQTDPTDYL